MALQYLYGTTSLTLILYLVVAVRKIDIFLIAGVSAVLFSAPLFFGEVSGPPGWPTREVEPLVYVSFIVLLLSLLVGAIVFDRATHAGSVDITGSRAYQRVVERFCSCGLVVLWAGLFTLILYEYGLALFFGESKRELMDQAGAAYVEFMWLSTLIATWLFYKHKVPGKAGAACVLLICLIIGHRAPMVLTGIALLLLYGEDWPRVSLLKRFPLSGPLLFLGAVFSVALLKPTYSHLKSEGVAGVVDLFREEGVRELMLGGMEFMRTQYYYNEMIVKGFSTDGGHLLRGPLSVLPFPRDLYTTSSNEFNELFQPVLFPGHVSGLAYNSVAEFYAALGFPGVIIFVGAFIAAIAILGILMRGLHGATIVVVAVVGALVSFYSFRNSLSVTFGFIRNVFWPFISILVVSHLIVTVCVPRNLLVKS